MEGTNFSDETVLSTPKPRASSTIHRPQPRKKLTIQKVPLAYSPNTSSSPESLGILSMDNIELTSELDTSRRRQSTNRKLQEQRALANSLLQKTPALGLSSRFFKPSESIRSSICSTLSGDSTVNESDLIRREMFAPEDISTPRSSCVSARSSSSGRDSVCSIKSMSQQLAELSKDLENSDFSISELCERFCNSIEQFQMDDESFVGGELAEAKLAEQERSWQAKLDVLGGEARSDSMFSQMDLSKQQESIITEFFRKKSELADLCLKDSPEKSLTPQPIINETTVSSTVSHESLTDDSVFSITEMENQIAACDNTTRIADYIGKVSAKPKSKRRASKENLPVSAPATPTKYPKSPLKDSTYFDNSVNKSTSTMHTASSLESLVSGKLPIETNRIELVWGCVRIGKRKSQTFVLRNKSQNKIRLQIASTNMNFRILNDSDVNSLSVVPVLMYPWESRAFTIVFTPLETGASVGKLNFTPISPELQQQQTKKQQVMLYAYGGHANVQTENVLKDTNMKQWLSLGKLDSRPYLTQTFVLHNTGNLAAFACLNYSSKGLYGYSKVSVHPTELVLQPKEQSKITVSYTPSKEDAKYLFTMSSGPVVEIGFIQVITGEEPVRGRIKRLCKKVKQESSMPGNPLMERLSKEFPNESALADVRKFTESVASTKELLQTFESKEIILTLERDSENSMMGQICGIDESSMFHSLAEGMVTMVASKTLAGSCTVEPNKVLLTPPGKMEDSILILSQSMLQFQISVSPSGILDVAPVEGILMPGEPTLIKVACARHKIQELQVFKVTIYVDNEMYEVEVKVVVVKSRNARGCHC